MLSHSRSSTSKMQSPTLSTYTSRFSAYGLRSPSRHPMSSTPSRRNSMDRHSLMSESSWISAANTINSIVLRQKSLLDLEEERRVFSSELRLLEPRPVVYFGSLEEQLGSP